ncbi:MAG TPA: hypothetical protein VFM74_00100 [Candidatus Limnocylindria bacterium]|nr:hypothetical protein [Candidatus Limnocylindria bacterium]
MGVTKVLRALVLGGAVAASAALLSATSVFAYGRADQPLAQIELSANCNNPSFPLCAPPPDGVGLGGLWFWVEVDAGGSADLAGAVCGHDRAGSGGALSLRGETEWQWFSGSLNELHTMGVEAFVQDPNDTYYIVTVPKIGEHFAFPATQGHYSLKPVSGVTIQITIAP